MADSTSGDSSDSGLDPEIEQLLDDGGDDPGADGPASPAQDPSDTVEQDVDDEYSSSQDPSADQDIEETTTWVEILDAPDNLSDEERVIQTWGRFWGEVEDVAAAFFLIIDPSAESDTVHTLRLAVYGNPTQLEEFHPRMEAEQFEQRILEYKVQGQAIPNVIFEQVDEGIRQPLSEGKTVDQLVEHLVEQDEEAFRSWFEQITDEVIQEGSHQFQVRAKFSVSPESGEDNDGSATANQTTSPDTTTSSDTTGDQSSGQKTGEGGELDVSIVNSPSKGVPADDLEPGMDIIIRIIDEKVEHLPDELIDDQRSSMMSIPLDARVREVNRISQLPPKISDGDPEDYREVIVELEDMVNGRALVYLGDRVKLKDQHEHSPQEMDEEFVNFLLLLGALVIIILTLVIMF